MHVCSGSDWVLTAVTWEDPLDQHRREWTRRRVRARLVAIAHRVQRRDQAVGVAAAERRLVGRRKVGRELDAVHTARASEAHGAAVRWLQRGVHGPGPHREMALWMALILSGPSWCGPSGVLPVSWPEQSCGPSKSADVSRARVWAAQWWVGAHVVLEHHGQRRSATKRVGG